MNEGQSQERVHSRNTYNVSYPSISPLPHPYLYLIPCDNLDIVSAWLRDYKRYAVILRVCLGFKAGYGLLGGHASTPSNFLTSASLNIPNVRVILTFSAK
jgi:hypothetical protein